MIERQISYNRRKDYFSLISEYLAKKINFGIFSRKFLKLQAEDWNTCENFSKVLNQLSDLSIDPELKNGPFSSLISYLDDVFMADSFSDPEEDELIEKDEINEEDFRISIQEALSNPELF